MNEILYRYNRFSNSYLVNYQNFEFEVDSELFSIINTYYNCKSVNIALSALQSKGIVLSKEDLLDIITNLESEKSDNEILLRSRTFKVIDFNKFNKLLNHNKISWIVFFVFVGIAFININRLSFYVSLPKENFLIFTNIILIIPIYYFSRLFFTPIHEFGHYFFYYLFTGKSAKFYVQFPGFLYFAGITTTDDLFYVPNPLKRILISLGGVIFELVFLLLILTSLTRMLDPFILQMITYRVILSILFNLNFLSQSTDGHILLTDLLGFTTFAETYNDYLKSLINRKFQPSVEVNTRVKIVLLSYTIFGLLFIIILIYSQLLFFKNIIYIMLIPLTQNISQMNLGIVEIFLIIITYLYYLDLVVRLYMKKIVVQKMIQIKKD